MAELPLRQRILDVLLPARGVDRAEQHVDLLERELLRLRDEEQDEGRHAEAEAAEHDERAPADVVDGHGSCERSAIAAYDIDEGRRERTY